MRRWILAITGLLVCVAVGIAADVVVLRGGARIELKQPWVQQGNNALLTRTDGTLLSVPIAEIDLKATAAARKAGPLRPAPSFVAAPETPAQAARAVKEGPRARVKITDSDVGHAAPTEAEEKANASPVTSSRLEVADFTQERSGVNVIVRGMLRNVGTISATQAKLNVSILDDQGKVIASNPATLSGATVESGNAVAFTGMVPVGEKLVGSVRFTPQWSEPPPPTPVGATVPGTAAAATAKAAPAPVPTPYGRGLLYANPAPSAAMSPSADGKTGYIPGATQPQDQPKPPD